MNESKIKLSLFYYNRLLIDATKSSANERKLLIYKSIIEEIMQYCEKEEYSTVAKDIMSIITDNGERGKTIDI